MHSYVYVHIYIYEQLHCQIHVITSKNMFTSRSTRFTMSNLSQVRFKGIFHDHLNMFHLKSSLLEVGYLRFTCDPQVAMPTTAPEASLKKNVEDKEEGQETADDKTEDTSEDDRLLQQKLSENFEVQDPYMIMDGDEDQPMMEDVKEERQDEGEEEEEEAQEPDFTLEEYLEGSKEEADLDQADQTQNANMEAAQEADNVLLKEEEDLDHEPDDPPRISIGGGSRRSPRSRSRKRRRRRSKTPSPTPSPDFTEFPGYHFIFFWVVNVRIAMTTSVSECFPVHHCSVVPALSKPFRLMKWAYLKEKDSKRRRHGSR